MTEILENVYNRLAFEKFEFGFTKAKFSKHYLGKSETYFSYLLSSGNDESANVLLMLWGKLNKNIKAVPLLPTTLIMSSESIC